MVFGENIFSLDTTAINKFSTWLQIFLATPIFSAVVFFIFKLADKINFSSDENLNPKKFFFFSFLLIFLSWLPPLFAQFPGIFAYDALAQVLSYNLNLIWLHFPPAHTWLLGFFTATLGKFFGSYELGFLFYTLVQMLCLSLTFAAILIYMFKKKLSKIFLAAWQIFFMFFPLNPIMAMSATKDIFYAIFFCLMILIFYFILDRNFSTKIFFALIAVGFLQIIFRPQGIYVFLFGMFFGFFLIKNLRIQLFSVTFSCVALYAIYIFVLTNFFGAVKDSNDTIREMSSVPVVQLSRVAIYRRDEISEEEFAEIKKYIHDVESYAEKISQGSSDFVKASFQSNSVQENPKKFFNLWKNFLLKYPTDYFDAFVRLTVPLWYPPAEFEKYYSAQPYFQYESFKKNGNEIIFFENPFENRTHKIFNIDSSFQIGERFISGEETKNNLIVIENKTFFGLDWLNNFYKNLAYNYSYEKIPVIKFLFSGGFIFWLLMIYIFYCLFKKNYREIFPASFFLGLWLTMLFGPITLYRYIFPIAVCLPILFLRLFDEEKI